MRLTQSPREWKAWFLSAKPEESPLPGDWENKCSDLQRLCVLRSLRADRILFSAATYVSNNLGPQFADPPAFDLKVWVRAVLFILDMLSLSVGSVPTSNAFLYQIIVVLRRSLGSVPRFTPWAMGRAMVLDGGAVSNATLTIDDIRSAR